MINMDIRDSVNPMEEVQRWATPPDVIKCEQVREFAPLSPRTPPRRSCLACLMMRSSRSWQTYSDG